MADVTVGSLFTGYGGLDMAVEQAYGARTAWVCEVDEAPARLLTHRRPGAPNLGDITAVDWDQVEPVDILTGGFPCQDLSTAGKRLGLRPGTRSGLWQHMAYAIDQLRPRMVVIENVRGLLSAEAHSDVEPCPWCVGDGPGEPALRALGAVLGDLAGLGFDARWGGVRASDAGAPHGRFRVFIVATPAVDAGHRTGGAEHGEQPEVTPVGAGQPGRGPAADADCGRREQRDTRLGRVRLADEGSAAASDAGRLAAQVPAGRGQPAVPVAGSESPPRGTGLTLLPTPAVNDMGEGKTVEKWDEWTAAMKARHGNGNGHRPSLAIEAQRWGDYAPAVARWEAVLGRPAPRPAEPGRDGRPRLSPWFVEWMMGLPAGWVTDFTLGLTRNQQLKMLGNGVVPQQAALALTHLAAHA